MDGALTAGNWPHPPVGPGAIDALLQAFGLEDASKLDMVYHSKKRLIHDVECRPDTRTAARVVDGFDT